ncbi:cupredoxin domain-containing protein [Hyphococcus sp.]|uniref:cupredoxin domain-containing protein n=1 Tax=Hyphococcus sp. TaxID=2038636 RepID=UPI00207E6143|nr:MAG: hypothetical protein DHS20C04_29250 [Marinicaulis sp.]
MQQVMTTTHRMGSFRKEGRFGALHPGSLRLAALFSLFALASCGAAEHETHALSAATTKTGKVHVIDIIDFRFEPDTLIVAPGDRITWRNRDVVPHTATASDKSWDSGNLNRDEEWSMIAPAAGAVDYICAYHPSMKGRITIADSSRN